MLIRHDCVDNKGLGDRGKAWFSFSKGFEVMKLWQFSVWCDNWLAYNWKMRPLNNYIIRVQELSTRLERTGEQLSEPLLIAAVLNGLSQRFEHFVVQESFNPAVSFVELRTRLMNYDESRKYRESVDNNDSSGDDVQECQTKAQVLKQI